LITYTHRGGEGRGGDVRLRTQKEAEKSIHMCVGVFDGILLTFSFLNKPYLF
jgi:hypothetical protein